MNEALKIQISAFVDGELPDNESEFLLRRLSQDVAMRQQVAEYLKIGRLLPRDRSVPGIDKLRDKIFAALGDEVLSEPEEKVVVGSKLITPASGIAVAATVAVVALAGLSQLATVADPGLQDNSAANDLSPAYTEPSVDLVMRNAPSAREMDLLRRHNNSDILYRMAIFEVDEDLEVVEPEEYLATATEPATEDQEMVSGN